MQDLLNRHIHAIEINVDKSVLCLVEKSFGIGFLSRSMMQASTKPIKKVLNNHEYIQRLFMGSHPDWFLEREFRMVVDDLVQGLTYESGS
ncbi:MAG: hypothetical protein C0582_02085 [Alphaproteobacteria bacterium]|nr:MAG: hypothetical protein C0582_02085 [Alphaproteobacteria bacterium]